MKKQAQPYVVDIMWSPLDGPEIVVDDVDEEFEIVYDSPPRTTLPAISFVRDLLGISIVEEWDNGLPLFLLERGIPPPKQRWVRRSDSRAYGKYRQTYTFVYKGKTERPSYAKFSATLSTPGRWRLDYHMPVEALRPNDRETQILLSQMKSTDWYERFPPGTTEVAVIIDEKRETIEFDAQAAEYGWNTLGEFDVGSKHTEVWISGASEQTTIYADAIRWVPMVEKDE